MRPMIVLAWLLPFSLALVGPRSTEAQPRSASPTDMWEGWSLGAALGRSGNEDEHHASKDRGRDLRGNLEVPLGSRWAVRVEAGRVSWRFDEYGPLHQTREDVVAVRRATLGLLGMTNPAYAVRGYLGGGLGLYHWNARVGTIDAPITRAGYFTMGLSVPVRRRDWAVTGELQVHIINSPNRTGRPGPEAPVSGSAVMSLTHSIGLRMYL